MSPSATASVSQAGFPASSCAVRRSAIIEDKYASDPRGNAG
jgi:hypothetical protein